MAILLSILQRPILEELDMARLPVWWWPGRKLLEDVHRALFEIAYACSSCLRSRSSEKEKAPREAGPGRGAVLGLIRALTSRATSNRIPELRAERRAGELLK